jgi:hypothetical protein
LGEGSFFKITPHGVFTSLYSFCAVGNCADGRVPGAIIQATDGNFYGTTGIGGNLGCKEIGCGVIFKQKWMPRPSGAGAPLIFHLPCRHN